MKKQGRFRTIVATVVFLGALPANQILAGEPAGDGGFDKLSFDAGMNNATTEATQHALSLGVAQKNLDAYLFLVSVGAQFVKDENGVFNEKANKEAFTAAVLNITPALLAKAKPFTDETGEKHIRAVVFALLAAADSFVQQPGQFNKAAFNAALFNSRFDALKATQFTGTESEREKTFLKLLRP